MQALEPWDILLKRSPELAGMAQRFVPGNHVYSGKGDQATTKVRPVFNQSNSDGEDPSFNWLSLKGPRSPPLTKAFTHLRQYAYAAMTDIRKAFYNLKIDLKAVALRKVWIPLDQDNNIAFGSSPEKVTWKIFAFTSCAMGDVGAPGVLYLAMCKAADLFCPGSDAMSRWTRLVISTTGYYDDFQAVGTTAQERDEMAAKLATVIRDAKMECHPWIKFNPKTKEMPLVPVSYTHLTLPTKRIV